jgi:hypothetical protein
MHVRGTARILTKHLDSVYRHLWHTTTTAGQLGPATGVIYCTASLATDNVHEMSQVTTVAICETRF